MRYDDLCALKIFLRISKAFTYPLDFPDLTHHTLMTLYINNVYSYKCIYLAQIFAF